MREPSFWWTEPGLASRLLRPLALGYGAVAERRLRQSGAAAGVPVICIGNLTLGGAGKTPTALTIARLLSEFGERPFFLTRGYGGKLAGPVRVDPASHRASDVGDEPLLLARRAPTIVSHDRVAGAQFARAAGASILVMDDGLQNPSLAKTLTIAVIDGRRAIGNAQVFPAGPLRAPLQAQLECVDALLVIGALSPASSSLAAIVRAKGCPVLRAALKPDSNAVKEIARRRVLAFAGIGDPEKFFTTLALSDIEAMVEESFPDHHHYTAKDAERLLERCDEKGLLPVTTEKDAVRLDDDNAQLAKLRSRAHVLPVTLAFDEENSILRLLKRVVAANRK